MCGIAGYVSDKAFAPEVLAAMTRSLAHRGPDADGFLSRGPAHLGHRRLSVIDIEGSPQPMTSPGGEVAGCFECGDKIFEARGKKPMRAFAADHAYSAAYLIFASVGDGSVTRLPYYTPQGARVDVICTLGSGKSVL